ncbi:hypothetical protein ACIQWN_37530 [Streptomyces vinaceus]|uniref:hypothetical protein n=1 Tax=Streptomyces vinaceus TaxID=1960 RepID=UPI00382D1C9D
MSTADAEHDMSLSWLCAQETARIFIEEDGTFAPEASFEYRATHDVLALSVLLSCSSSAEQGERRAVRGLVDNDVEWALWCENRLMRGALTLSPTDLALAIAAWQWLAGSRLIGGTFHLQECRPTAMLSGVGVTVGVTEARRLLDRYDGPLM